MRSIIPLSTCIFAVMTVSAQIRADGDPVRGESLYNSRCIACHSLDSNRVGPMHRGVYGREAGSVADYEYSPALAKASVIWSDRTLDRWLQNPEALIPGQKMGFSVPVAKDRSDIIAFLKRESGR